MAYKGKRITNLLTGQTIEFISTSKETHGKLLEMVATWEPHSKEPMEHYHPAQDESFTVLDGILTIAINGRKWALLKGDSIDIPAGATHAMWNAGSKKAVVTWKVSPALNTEYLLETGMGLASDGKTSKNGMPGILQTTLLARKYRDEFRLNKPPYLLQKILFGLLTPLALLSGKKAVYTKYID